MLFLSADLRIFFRCFQSRTVVIAFKKTEMMLNSKHELQSRVVPVPQQSMEAWKLIQSRPNLLSEV